MWPGPVAIHRFLPGVEIFFLGYLIATIISTLWSHRRFRDINPSIKAYKGPGRRKTDAGKVAPEIARVESERAKDKMVDQGIANYENSRRRPKRTEEGNYSGATGGEVQATAEALRRVHEMESAKPFSCDMQCPECHVIALRGFRMVHHAAHCSQTQPPERMD
jgi:hypothetical protein